MYNYTLTNGSMTIIFKSRAINLKSTDKNFQEVWDFLKSGEVDDDKLQRLIDKKTYIVKSSNGLVKVDGNRVLYDGEEVHNSLVTKLLTLCEEGFDVTPWANFMANLMQNPSYKSRQDLFDFLEEWQAPLTPDGCFIAFKNVRENFFDIHSGTMDNSPGKVVSMPRDQVNDDSRQTCSAGLHCCATSYLNSFYVSGGKTVIVKVNPRDVVSVPHDYNQAKMRVCKYEVLSEVAKESIEETAKQPVHTTPLDEYEEILEYDYDDYYNSYDDSYYSSYD